MKKILITLLFFISSAFAKIVCYDLDEYQGEIENLKEVVEIIESKIVNDNYNQCITEGGVGSEFSMQVTQFVKTCAEYSGSKKGYLKFQFMCDYCTAEKINDELNNFEKECADACMSSDAYCEKADLIYEGGWGGKLVNNEICGDFDPTLPGCEESSSSEIIELSSSENSSSSLIESSSSKTESSSSESDENSSSSEDVALSSCKEENESSSSESEEECGEGGVQCGGSNSSGEGGAYCQIDEDYWKALSRLPNIHQDLYIESPYMLNRDYVYLQNCYCTGTRAVACDFQNFGLVQGYEPVTMPMCGLYEGYWCNGISSGACDFTGMNTRLYYSDSPETVGFTWAAPNFDNSGSVLPIETGWQTIYLNRNGVITHLFSIRHLLPTNVMYFDLERIVLESLPAFPDMDKLVAYCMGEWVPHDDDCFGTENEVNIAMQDSSDNCSIGYGIPHYQTELSERGWCVVGTCEPGEEPYYSSSSYASSSSSEESSSSSEFGLCQSLPFGYIPSDPKSTCFESNGKCYRCNAARRADECDEEWMWIYPYTPDKYFFTEIDCISGERKDNNRIGQCPGFPMETTPYNPEQACIAHNGKCYRCKSENSYVNCSHNWLWTGENFGTHNIGLWYEEVDCYDPFEKEDFDGQCPDEIVLMKRTADFDDESSRKDNAYSIDLLNTARYFDALGRSISRIKSAQQPFYKKINSKMNDYNEKKLLQQTIDKIYKEVKLRKASHNLLKRQDCGILRSDYGIIENGQKIGGITCPDAEPSYSPPNVIDHKFLEETCSVNRCEYKKVWLKLGARLEMTLKGIDYYVVNVGYVFPDGYVTTQIDHDAVEKHEKGHVADFQCIANKFSNESKYVEIEVEACNEKGALNAAIEDAIKPYLNEMQKEYDLRFMKATERYHSKYGSFEYPGNDYVCPNDL
ncbi:MAG: hypothetical protein IIU83_01970 [Fibrobacteraceae bacterium]|nr:hypothetical protein [Fibrobacteraceae bacterium]